MMTLYFTFGFDHVHERLGRHFDKDVIVKIIDEDPRALMFHIFDRDWAFYYPEEKALEIIERYGYEVVEIAGPKVVTSA